MMQLLSQAAPPPDGTGAMQFFPIALMIAVVAFMLLTARSQRAREKRERDAMYSKLAKNDRVLTIGGIIGTVISLRDGEVVLKVDESTNTKMTFLKTAVQRILTDEPASESQKT